MFSVFGCLTVSKKLNPSVLKWKFFANLFEQFLLFEDVQLKSFKTVEIVCTELFFISYNTLGKQKINFLKIEYTFNSKLKNVFIQIFNLFAR